MYILVCEFQFANDIVEDLKYKKSPNTPSWEETKIKKRKLNNTPPPPPLAAPCCTITNPDEIETINDEIEENVSVAEVPDNNINYEKILPLEPLIVITSDDLPSPPLTINTNTLNTNLNTPPSCGLNTKRTQTTSIRTKVCIFNGLRRRVK